MKQGKIFISLLFTALWLTVPVMAQQLVVGSYNLRNKNNGDSIKGEVWSKRCQVICDQVNFISPAILGTQELLHVQILDMLSALDGYDYIGVARDDGATKGEYSAIFYKKDRLKLLEQGNFWLSETPDRPGLGWDAACIRICTWGKFKDRQTKKKFYCFNLHMDHVGTVARREAAKLVVSKVQEIAKGAVVVLTGDFNVDQTDKIYGIFTHSGLLADSYETARLRFAENGTFNSFKPQLKTTSRIDHVFVSPTVMVEAYGVLTDSYWTPLQQSADNLKGDDAPQEISFGEYQRRNPSDHYPVFVRMKLK
ncbi:MAG: endonuclease/exonuclease/phosphatase family protein [Prevotella sp.]|nr:endonuclease/exonuclease/phosphatase family protein [Prevotella sp.]